MIVVSVHLVSARNGQVTELARMEICNDDTGTHERRNYIARVLRGRSQEQLDRRRVHRSVELKDWPSLQRHIWQLVAVILAKLGYVHSVPMEHPIFSEEADGGARMGGRP
jgi:hypothetical protein